MQRIFGRLLIGIGSLVLLWTLVWVALYFIERGADWQALVLMFTAEVFYWTPVALLGLPGIILIHHGRKLQIQEEAAAFAVVEVCIVFAILGIVAALVVPADNFSYVAASIVQSGMKAAEPAQRDIENYYSTQGSFPDNTDSTSLKWDGLTADSHIRSISLGEAGRVVIAFDTSDIDWRVSWWQRLLMVESNDLTGKTLILVPVIVAGNIVWDECKEGSVPQRSRHFKCSGHK